MIKELPEAYRIMTGDEAKNLSAWDLLGEILVLVDKLNEVIIRLNKQEQPPRFKLEYCTHNNPPPLNSPIDYTCTKCWKNWNSWEDTPICRKQSSGSNPDLPDNEPKPLDRSIEEVKRVQDSHEQKQKEVEQREFLEIKYEKCVTDLTNYFLPKNEVDDYDWRGTYRAYMNILKKYFPL